MNLRGKGRLILILASLIVCIFSYFSAIGILSALLVDLSKEFGSSVAGMGQLITVSVVVFALTAMIGGPFSDRIGRKWMVVLSQTILGVALLGFGISQNIFALIAFSVLLGFGGGIGLPNSLSSVSDYFSISAYGRALSVIYGGQPLAALAGVPAGAFIADRLGWHWSFFTLGVFTLLAAGVTSIVLTVSGRSLSEKDRAYLVSFKEAFRQRNFLAMMAGNTLHNGAHFIIATYLAAFLMQSYSLGVGEIAPLLSFIGVSQLIGVLIGGTIADKFNKIKICIFTQVVGGLISFVLMGYAKNIFFSIILCGIFMGIYGMNRPAFLSPVLFQKAKP